MLPRGSFTDSIRLAYNALILANTAGADAICDIGSDPTIGTVASLTNTALWLADQDHLTSLGYSYVAETWAAAVNSLFIQI